MAEGLVVDTWARVEPWYRVTKKDQKKFSGSKFLAKFVRKLFVFDNFLRKIKIMLLGQPVLYGGTSWMAMAAFVTSNPSQVGLFHFIPAQCSTVVQSTRETIYNKLQFTHVRVMFYKWLMTYCFSPPPARFRPRREKPVRPHPRYAKLFRNIPIKALARNLIAVRKTKTLKINKNYGAGGDRETFIV